MGTQKAVRAAARARGIAVTFDLAGTSGDGITFDAPAGHSFAGDHSARLSADAGLARQAGDTRADIYRAALTFLADLDVEQCDDDCPDCEDRAAESCDE